MKNKILSILLSVGIAIALWIFVITVVDPDYTRTYRVPVNTDEFQYSSVLSDRKLMIMDCDEYVTVTLKGNRSVLVNIHEGDLKLQASVANINGAGDYQLEYSISVPGAVLVEKQNPEKISLKVDEKVTKELEIKPEIVGEVPDGFADDQSDLFDGDEDGKVTIVGPGSVVKNIDHAKLDSTIDLTGKKEDIIGNYELVLCDKNGKPVDAKGVTILGSKNVSIRIKIEMFKDLQLTFDITEGGGLTKENVTWTPQTIRISGPKSVIEKMGDSFVVGELDLSTLDMDQKLAPFPIDLKDDSLVNRTGIDEVTVTVNFGVLTQKTLMVERIETVCPEGMTAVVDRKKIPVTVRGPVDQLDKITAEDITVTVDFSDATAGTNIKSAQISISGHLRDVVAVGEPEQVSATLTKKEG